MRGPGAFAYGLVPLSRTPGVAEGGAGVVFTWRHTARKGHVPLSGTPSMRGRVTAVYRAPIR